MRQALNQLCRDRFQTNVPDYPGKGDVPYTLVSKEFHRLFKPFFHWYYKTLMSSENRKFFYQMKNTCLEEVDEFLFDTSHPNTIPSIPRHFYRSMQHWHPRNRPDIRAKHLLVHCSYCYWPVADIDYHWQQKHKNIEAPIYDDVLKPNKKIQLMYLLPSTSKKPQYIRDPIDPQFANWKDMRDRPGDVYPVLMPHFEEALNKNGGTITSKKAIFMNLFKNQDYKKLYHNAELRQRDMMTWMRRSTWSIWNYYDRFAVEKKVKDLITSSMNYINVVQRDISPGEQDAITAAFIRNGCSKLPYHQCQQIRAGIEKFYTIIEQDIEMMTTVKQEPVEDEIVYNAGEEDSVSEAEGEHEIELNQDAFLPNSQNGNEAIVDQEQIKNLKEQMALNPPNPQAAVKKRVTKTQKKENKKSNSN